MRPLVVGIAGGSGSGKSTVAARVASALPATDIACIEYDAYYRERDDLSYEQRSALNFDHPDSLESELLVEHLRRLRGGEAVDVPIYDFTQHRRATEVKRVEPAPVVVVEGILIFAEKALREMLDIKLYVDTDSDIRAFRRIRRDIEHRGRTFNSVREQYYRTVRPMHMQFVEPSKRYADLIIPEGGENKVGVGLVVAMVRERARGVVSEFGEES